LRAQAGLNPAIRVDQLDVGDLRNPGMEGEAVEESEKARADCFGALVVTAFTRDGCANRFEQAGEFGFHIV
jgi:hypothetical protein